MEEISIVELACNKYNMVLDVSAVVAGTTYGYKFWNINYDEPEYYTDIIFTNEDVTTLLEAADDGVFFLKILKTPLEGDATTEYRMMVCMCAMEACKEYILKQILCGDNLCNPRHDCDNCDDLRDKWNIRLSEMQILYYEMRRLIDKYAAILEDTLVADEDLIKIRLRDIINKIIVMTASCTSCISCEDPRRRCTNCN